MQERLVSYMFYLSRADSPPERGGSLLDLKSVILHYISTKPNVKKDSIVQKYKIVLQ